MRFELGLFERDPSTVPFSTLSVAKDVDTPEHRQLARQSAAESLVLLRNTGLLPLDSSRPVQHYYALGLIPKPLPRLE